MFMYHPSVNKIYMIKFSKTIFKIKKITKLGRSYDNGTVQNNISGP